MIRLVGVCVYLLQVMGIIPLDFFLTFILKVFELELEWKGGTHLLGVLILKHSIPFLNWNLVPSY